MSPHRLILVVVVTAVVVAACGPARSSQRSVTDQAERDVSPVSERDPSDQRLWKGEAISGLPATARVWDVAAAESGRLVAVGTVAEDDCAAVPLVVWTSDDGLAWEEGFRTREGFGAGGSFCGEAHAALSAHAGGFAIVGFGCGDVCSPAAFHSADGLSWARSSVPVPPGRERSRRSSGGTVGVQLGRRMVVRATPDYALSGAAMHDVAVGGDRLVAVGWEERRGEPFYATSEAAWISDDGGKTWRLAAAGAFPDDDRTQLDRVVFTGERFVAGGGNRCCYDQATPNLWVSDDGARWTSAMLPAGEAVSVDMLAAREGEAHVVGRRSLYQEGEPSSAHWRLEPSQKSWVPLPDPPVLGELVGHGDELVLVGVQEERLVLFRSADGRDFELSERSHKIGGVLLEAALSSRERVLVLAFAGESHWLYTTR